MASSLERIGIVETKVENLNEKLDNLKVDVKEMHDCLDQTRDFLAEQLKAMADASNLQHEELAKKISAMEKLKDKWTYTVVGAVAVLGWVSGHMSQIVGFFK